MLPRRDFLKTSALAGASALLSGCRRSEAPGGEGGAEPEIPPFELDEVSVLDLQRRMEEGSHTSESIVSAYLDRIRQIDQAGPELRSVIEVNPDALTIAAALDEERRTKGSRGPLHGIPVLIKDNIDTADRMQTTAGSLALEGRAPDRDAVLVERLRAAGAVLLGKTNLSEWANFRSTRSSSGWSGRGGQTRNPYAPDRNPCGSSSGSAVAVSANLCTVAVGTETDGSVVCPASVNGIVGIKPTLGMVSRGGIIPIAHSQDTAGPMARTVTDALLLLQAMEGVDPADSATTTAGRRALPDPSQVLVRDGLRGARIGVVRNLFGYHGAVDALIEEAIEVMKTQGAEMVDPVNVDTVKELGEAEYEVLLYEFKADINAYLANRTPAPSVRTLADLIAFNETNRDREMPYFGQEIFLSAQEKGPLTDKAYLDALAKCRRLARTEGIDAAVGKHNLDALIAPTGGPAWPTDLVNGDHFLGASSTLAAVSGYPNITVPAGLVHGLPVGLSFFGSAYSEAVLIRLAFAFEQATLHRTVPGFRPWAPPRHVAAV